MTRSNLPLSIAALFDGLRAPDARVVQAALGKEVDIYDRGARYKGRAAIDAWTGHFTAGRPTDIRPIEVREEDGQWRVMTLVYLARPADPLTLDWRFTLGDEGILALSIACDTRLDLPAPVEAYVSASNAGNLDGLLDAFADDALVNDQFHDYWGRQEIREWAARNIIDDRLSMHVTKVVRHYGQTIVTANVDGIYPKRGLPDPLVLAFYFSAPADRIVQLIILRNQGT